MSRWGKLAILAAAMGIAGPVWAQADAATERFDASLPDASAGEGGADRDNPEGEDAVGRTPTVCRESPECERGFTCEAGRCVYVGFRRADRGGCALGAPAAMLVAGALLARARARRG